MVSNLVIEAKQKTYGFMARHDETCLFKVFLGRSTAVPKCTRQWQPIEWNPGIAMSATTTQPALTLESTLTYSCRTHHNPKNPPQPHHYNPQPISVPTWYPPCPADTAGCLPPWSLGCTRHSKLRTKTNINKNKARPDNTGKAQGDALHPWINWLEMTVVTAQEVGDGNADTTTTTTTSSSSSSSSSSSPKHVLTLSLRSLFSIAKSAITNDQCCPL